jgi:hypothetical protein
MAFTSLIGTGRVSVKKDERIATNSDLFFLLAGINSVLPHLLLLVKIHKLAAAKCLGRICKRCHIVEYLIYNRWNAIWIIVRGLAWFSHKGGFNANGPLWKKALRYVLIGAWISAGAPWTFVKLNLAKKVSPI